LSKDHRRLPIILGVLVLIFLIGPLLGGGMMGQRMTGGYQPQGTSGMKGWTWDLIMGIALVSTFAFWGAIIVGIVVLVRWLVSTNASSNDTQDSTLETLRRRFAGAETSPEEYQRMSEALERSGRDDRY
jgi:uncharacterized membrane protein